MKGKDRENLKSLRTEELAAELQRAREKYFRLRFEHRITPLKNPLQIRELRRQVARLQTYLREKASRKQGSVQ